MAETNVEIYKNLGANNQQMTPLQILQLLGQANNLKLQQQNIDANTGVAESFKNNVNPDGTLNYPGLSKALAGSAGIKAPETLNAVVSNTAAYNALRQTQQDTIQKRFGAIGSLPNPTMGDIYSAGIDAMRDNPTIPPEMITKRIDEARSIKDPKKLKEWALKQGITAPSFEANVGETGTPDATGAPQVVSRGARTMQQGGVAPIINGAPVGVSPSYSAAASSEGAQSGASANALTVANDTSTTRKGMLGNLEEDLTKFTSGPGADWTKVAKSWVNRNVPKPKGWEFDPASIAGQEQFVKQAAQLSQAQFQALGGSGSNAQFNASYEVNPNDTLSQLGNKGIIRLLKGNEDAIQAKAKAWRKWRRDGNGPDTYADFSDQFNSNFDPRVFQFKYIPEKDRQEYVDRMDPADKLKFLTDMTHARKQGWVQFRPVE